MKYGFTASFEAEAETGSFSPLQHVIAAENFQRQQLRILVHIVHHYMVGYWRKIIFLCSL